MTTQAKIAVILVNYNNEEYTIECLNTLSNQTLDNFVTIVVDNGSDPGSIEKVKKKFDFPVYLENRENLGFSGGNNRGIEYALIKNVDWILLLNNDTEVEPEFIENALTAAESLPDITGIMGPKIHSYDSEEVWAAGAETNGLTGRTTHRTGQETTIDNRAQVDYVVGAAFFVRSEVFQDIGLLDDEFFIYYEETEFCRRAKQSGWEIWYVPVSGVFHKESVEYSFSVFREYYFTRNRWLFVRKTQPLCRRLVFYPYFFVRWVVFQIAYLLVIQRNPAAAKATLQGAIHAVIGKTGKLED